MKSVNKLQQFLLSTAISLLLLIGILYGASNLYNLHNDVEQNKETVDAFLTEYQASVEYTQTNLDETAALCETYGVIPKAAVAKQAIPRCSITFQSGTAMRDIATANLTVLYEANAQSVGGSLPGEDCGYGV